MHLTEINQDACKKLTGVLLLSAVSLVISANSPSRAVAAADATVINDLHPHDDFVMQKGVHSQVTIKASPEIVWKSMRAQRHVDKDSKYVKVFAQDKQDGDVEQSFAFKTIFGDAECTLALHEQKMTRVDYKLKGDSPDFKRFEGRWMLTSPDGKTSTLELVTYAEVYKPLPRMIVNAIMQTKINGQLAMVKTLAEQSPVDGND